MKILEIPIERINIQISYREATKYGGWILHPWFISEFLGLPPGKSLSFYEEHLPAKLQVIISQQKIEGSVPFELLDCKFDKNSLEPIEPPRIYLPQTNQEIQIPWYFYNKLKKFFLDISCPYLQYAFLKITP